MSLFPLALPNDFRVIGDAGSVPAALRGGAVVIGNFDGVHRGHKAVIAAARTAGHPAVGVTLEPHPRSVFRPDMPVPRLWPEREKLALLAEEGLDAAVVLRFDAALASLTAEDFVRRILVDRLGAATVVLGYDFHFGARRSGSPDFLRKFAPRFGFETVVVPALGNGVPVSSSLIREALAAGRIVEANHMLGHRWFVIGTVAHGDKRGRTLGYPTANILLPPETPLAFGIYAVRAVVGATVRQGVASFGRRPTFDDGAAKLEVFLFDFDGDLYGQSMAVSFAGFIRRELRFDDVGALVVRMAQDCDDARAILAARPEAGTRDLFAETGADAPVATGDR